MYLFKELFTFAGVGVFLYNKIKRDEWSRRGRGKRRRRRSNLTVRKVQVQVPSRSIAVCRRRKAGIINLGGGCTLTPLPPPPPPPSRDARLSRRIFRVRVEGEGNSLDRLFFYPGYPLLKATQLSFPASFFFFTSSYVLSKQRLDID